MGRTAGRSREDTRTLILDAAGAVVRRQGLGATLDQIASEAGLSKGGLIYHFASKSELLRALADRLVAQFRSEVMAEVDGDDSAAGSLVRGYIRAGIRDAGNSAALREQLALDIQLMADPAVQAVMADDQSWWREQFALDGLPEAVVRVVVAAVDGVSSGPLTGTVLESEDLRGLERALLRLTRPPHALGEAPG